MPKYSNKAELFLNSISEFNKFNKKTIIYRDEDIPYFNNEYWTARQRASSNLHEVSYRACFKPQLPEFFIQRLTQEGDRVYDPFMGRGTTPIQAALMGRHPVGSDVNPLSLLLTRPRINPPELDDIKFRLDQIDLPKKTAVNLREDLLPFFHKTTLNQICYLRELLLDTAPITGIIDPVIDWIRMVALNRLTGHSSGFFSVYTLPPNQAVSIESQIKINMKRNQIAEEKDISSLIYKKSKFLLKDYVPKNIVNPDLFISEAHNTKHIKDNSIDLVITSPPFLNIVNYKLDNWMRNWFAGVNDNINISHIANLNEWTEMIHNVIKELARVIKPGGFLAFEVGEVRGGKHALEKNVWNCMANLPFQRLAILVNQQDFTKTANCWGISNNQRGVNTNRIVIAQKI